MLLTMKEVDRLRVEQGCMDGKILIEEIQHFEVSPQIGVPNGEKEGDRIGPGEIARHQLRTPLRDP